MAESSDFVTRFDAIKDSVKPGQPLISGTAELSYGELFERCTRLFALFQAQKLQIGDRVVLATHDDKALACVFLALLRHGITAVMVDPDAKPFEINNLIRASDPQAVFMDADKLEALQPQLQFAGPFYPIKAERGRRGLLRVFKRNTPTDNSFPALLDPLTPATPPISVPADTTAMILFTSGTTSQPKGVELTHGNLSAQMETFIRHYQLDSQTHLLNALPMHHSDGLNQGLSIAFYCQGGVHRPGSFSLNALPDFLHSVYRERISHAVVVPTMLAMIQQMDSEFDDSFRSEDFRFVISTAGPLDQGLWQNFETRFATRVVNSYGLTETVCEALYCGPDDDTRRLGTIGKPVDCQVRVVDEAGNPVTPGQVGELHLRGANIMKGYFRHPEATAAVLQDGWLLTGDLVRCDDDGYYQIVGRKKNIIIHGGFNIYPEDVNEALLAIPGVVDVVTVGMPDPAWGEQVVSCVILQADEAPSMEELYAQCRERLAPEKVPNSIHIVDELPRGPAGKVILNEVKQWLAQREEPTVEAAGGSVDELVLTLAASVFKVPVERLSGDSTMDTTPGWDSLSHVNLLVALEKQFSVQFGPRDVMRVQKLRDAARLVREKQS